MRSVSLLIAIVFHSNLFAAVQTEKLYKTLFDAKAYNRAEALALMPDVMKENFVLINNSRSRQKGTFELPRVLHFSKSADFIVTSSGHSIENDVAANDLEIFEFDRIENKWIPATIHLNGDSVSKPEYNGKSCLACHGKTPRPIWGSYPNWPDSYGGKFVNSPDKMEPDEKVKFLKFVEVAKNHEAYKHLKINPSENGYLLPSVYPLPNSVFTARIANLHINFLFFQLQKQTEVQKLKYNFLARAFSCTEIEDLQTEVTKEYARRLAEDLIFAGHWANKPFAMDEPTQLLRLLGLDPTENIDLNFVSNFNKPIMSELALNWSAGSDYLGDMLAFRILNSLVKTDTELNHYFENFNEKMTEIELSSFSLSNAELVKLDAIQTKSEYRSTLYPSIRYSVLYSVLGANKQSICKILKTKALSVSK